MTVARVLIPALVILPVAGYVALSVDDVLWARGFPDSRRAWVESLRAEGRLPNCNGELRAPVREFEAKGEACFQQAEVEEARVLNASTPSQQALVLVYACETDDFAARFLFTTYRTDYRTWCSYDLAADRADLRAAYGNDTAFLAYEERTVLARAWLAWTED